MSLPVYIEGRSDVGRQRTQNEDAWRVEALPDGSRLLIVCDGMGGHEGGEVASTVATQRIVEVVANSSPEEPPRTLYHALQEANAAVRAEAQARGTQGMGTTAVVAWVLGERCYVGWVGDSRLYHFREGALSDQTEDHTRVAQMVQRGILTPEEAKKHPDAHVLVQALGGSDAAQQGFKPEVWNEPLELKHGDVVLLCSDGLYDFIGDEELYPLMERRDYQAAAEWLVATANERGGADNITVILLVAGQPEVPAQGSTVPRPRRETVPELTAREVTPTPAPSPQSFAPAEVTHAPAPSPVSGTPFEPGRAAWAQRQVPLWWVGGAAALALGVGFGMGLAMGGTSSSGSGASVGAGPGAPAAMGVAAAVTGGPSVAVPGTGGTGQPAQPSAVEASDAGAPTDAGGVTAADVPARHEDAGAQAGGSPDASASAAAQAEAKGAPAHEPASPAKKDTAAKAPAHKAPAKKPAGDTGAR